MSAVSRRTYGIALTGVLAMVAAAVAFFVLTQSGKASDVDLTTAKLVPADAGLYFALNTDLSASQWVSAFKLIERMGQDDPEGKLKEAAGEGGVDWEGQVAPFLGGDAAFFFRSAGIDIADFSGGAIIRCKDVEKCLAVLLEGAGAEDELAEEYEGVAYGNVGPGFAAVTGDHLVIAIDEETLFAVLDVAAGRGPSLASVTEFQNLRDELAKDFLAFLYVNSGDLFGETLMGDPVIRRAIDESGAGGFVLEPVAAVIAAKDAGFAFQEAAAGKAGVVSPMLRPNDSRFVKAVPSDTAVFVSTTGLAQAWDEAVSSARAEIDEAIRESGQYEDLEDALTRAGAELGLASLEEIIDLLHGETAFAFWFPGGEQDNVEGLLLAEVTDEVKARDVLRRVTESAAQSRPSTSRIGNVEVTTLTADDGDQVAYAVAGGTMYVGTPVGLRAVLDRTATPLAELPSYQRTVKEMPSALGSFGYFNIATLVRLTTGGQVAPLDEAAAALDGLIINVVNERDIARFNGVLTVKD